VLGPRATCPLWDMTGPALVGLRAMGNAMPTKVSRFFRLAPSFPDAITPEAFSAHFSLAFPHSSHHGARYPRGRWVPIMIGKLNVVVLRQHSEGGFYHAREHV
jgi:hypothetical protein